MNKQYPPGNPELLRLIQVVPFDRARAEALLQTITDINQPILNLHSCATTYLSEAVTYSNLDAARMLLEHGADVNMDLDGDCPLWDLQYDEHTEEDTAARYEIAKLFFEYGADPNLISDNENLYDWVMDAVFNDAVNNGWEHRCDFLKLLVIYGGGGKGGYPKPVFVGTVDKQRIDDYFISFEFCEDGYHLIGWLIDADGTKLARL